MQIHVLENLVNVAYGTENSFSHNCKCLGWSRGGGVVIALASRSNKRGLSLKGKIASGLRARRGSNPFPGAIFKHALIKKLDFCFLWVEVVGGFSDCAVLQGAPPSYENFSRVHVHRRVLRHYNVDRIWYDGVLHRDIPA